FALSLCCDANPNSKPSVTEIEVIRDHFLNLGKGDIKMRVIVLQDESTLGAMADVTTRESYDKFAGSLSKGKLSVVDDPSCEEIGREIVRDFIAANRMRCH